MTTSVLPIDAITSVIVLDLDDTLYLERDYVLSGFRAVSRWIEDELGILGFEKIVVELFAAGVREKLFDRTLRELGVAHDSSLIDRLVGVYRKHPPNIRLLSDVEVFLSRKRHARAIALLTDGHLIAQRNKVRALRLDNGAISPIICTDIWGRAYWKPHCRGFRHIQAHFRLSPSAFVYVADNPAKDFVGPRTLGWRTVQVARPNMIHSPAAPTPSLAADFKISNLAELTDERLDQLFEGPALAAPA